MMVDVADGRLVPLDQCTVQAGPAASAGMRQRLEGLVLESPVETP